MTRGWGPLTCVSRSVEDLGECLLVITDRILITRSSFHTLDKFFTIMIEAGAAVPGRPGEGLVQPPGDLLHADPRSHRVLEPALGPRVGAEVLARPRPARQRDLHRARLVVAVSVADRGVLKWENIFKIQIDQLKHQISYCFQPKMFSIE